MNANPDHVVPTVTELPPSGVTRVELQAAGVVPPSEPEESENEIEFTQNEYDPAIATAGTWNWTAEIPLLGWNVPTETWDVSPPGA